MIISYKTIKPQSNMHISILETSSFIAPVISHASRDSVSIGDACIRTSCAAIIDIIGTLLDLEIKLKSMNTKVSFLSLENMTNKKLPQTTPTDKQMKC